MRNRINVVYTKSRDMIADGLTKVLLADKFNRFRDQMGLVDISDKIQDDKDQEDQEGKGTITHICLMMRLSWVIRAHMYNLESLLFPTGFFGE